jgi:hypothetical protein
VFIDLSNDPWVLIAASLVLVMGMAVGSLEVGKLAEGVSLSLRETDLFTGIALVVRESSASTASSH